MCGLAGYSGRRPLAAAVRNAMLAPLLPRGPDAQGQAAWDADWHPTCGAAAHALLHTRLSIRDPRLGANQPMATDDGSVWVCYNGEVYGWQDEAAALAAQGYPFRTTSDTEFILNAYLAWGEDGLLARLRGMFALAILDLRQRRLLLIRDRLGIKPLLYAQGDGEIAFASTLRALLPWLPPSLRTFDPAAIDAYLAHRYIPAPATLIPSVKRLLPGQMARYDLTTGVLTTETYWSCQPRDDGRPLAETVREAILLRLESDRPVGVFLSGGIDSATVASVLAEAAQPVCATAAFPGSPLDETPLAAAIAGHLGLPHRALPIQPRVAEDFERMVADLDEPFADPSAIPLWYLAQATRQAGLVVVMGGDGGDELFAGYKRYAKHLGKAWRGRWRLPGQGGAARSLPGKLAKLGDELRLDWLEAYALRFSGLPPSLRRHLQPQLPAMPATHWQGMAATARQLWQERRLTPLQALLQLDRANYLPEYVLRKADLCTMAHGLELRVPLLDHRLAERVEALPAVERFTTPAKRALAEVCRPAEALGLFSQPKRGFNPPLGQWLRQEWRDHLPGLGLRVANATGQQLDGARCQGLVDHFLAGQSQRAEQVYQLLMLAASLEQLKRAGPATTATEDP